MIEAQIPYAEKGRREISDNSVCWSPTGFKEQFCGAAQDPDESVTPMPLPYGLVVEDVQQLDRCAALLEVHQLAVPVSGRGSRVAGFD